jgi:hypothetical protein
MGGSDVLTETIQWRDVGDELPDDAEYVLLAFIPHYTSTPTGMGFCGDGYWYLHDHCPVLDDGAVTHWAPMPAGPGAAQ